MLMEWGRFRSEWERLPYSERSEQFEWWLWRSERQSRIQKMRQMEQEARARMNPSSNIPRAPRRRR